MGCGVCKNSQYCFHRFSININKVVPKKKFIAKKKKKKRPGFSCSFIETSAACDGVNGSIFKDGSSGDEAPRPD